MLIEILFALLFSTISLAALYPLLEKALNTTFKEKHQSENSAVVVCELETSRPPYRIYRCNQQNSQQWFQVLTKSDSGFSVPETIISLALGLTLLTAMCKFQAVLSTQSRNIQSWLKDYYISAHLERELIRLFQSTDSHPFNFTPKLHSNGNIVFKNGAINPVVNGNTKFRPSPLSDAITNFQLVTEMLSDITDCQLIDQQINGQACLRYLSSASTSSYQSFMVISIDGSYEAQGSFKGTGRCKQYSLSVSESMIFDSPKIDSICNYRLIIPLDFIQTIYQSQTGDFRLISHRNQANVENQPLTAANPMLNISLNLEQSAPTLSLQFTIHSQQTSYQRHIHSFLGKQSADNFIFNIL